VFQLQRTCKQGIYKTGKHLQRRCWKFCTPRALHTATLQNDGRTTLQERRCRTTLQERRCRTTLQEVLHTRACKQRRCRKFAERRCNNDVAGSLQERRCRKFYSACIVRCTGLCHYHQGNQKVRSSHFMLHFKNLSSGLSH